MHSCANVAQSVEQLIRNQQVAGSIPAISSKLKNFQSTLCIVKTQNIIEYTNWGKYGKEEI